MSIHEPRMMMIDLETLDVVPEAVVFQLGYTIFTETEIIDRKFFSFNVLEQLILGRSIGAGAVKFWQEQPREIWDMDTWDPSKYSTIQQANAVLVKDWNDHNVQYVWANSPAFDCIIWEHLCRQFKLTVPWNHRSQLDMRTLKMIGLTLNAVAKKEEPSHRADQDSLIQAQFVQDVLTQIRAKTK